MKSLLFLLIGFLLLGVNGYAQTILECDFSNPKHAKKTMRYHWNVYNSIAPVEEFRVLGTSLHEYVNVVRPLGGKVTHNGSRTKVIKDDTYKWDGQKYVYDWAPLKKQLDNILAEKKIHQLNLDNPPWAFQRGLKLTEEQEINTYGNPWAPNDPDAWAAYIKAMLRELIKTYGREQVGQWRYCVGREIGTPGHWQAGEQAYFEHYKNTEQAVREVLPEAKVGTHLLKASNKRSFGQNFIPWCKKNGAQYDFFAISFYPRYHWKRSVDLDYVYKNEIAPFVESPDWNPEATFEIHEYAVLEDMVNHRAMRASRLHRNVYTLMLAKMLYEKNLHDVFVWTDAPAYKEVLRLLKGLEGHTYYRSSKRGKPKVKGNMIDAIFSSDPAAKLYEVSAYNYNANPKVSNKEPLIVRATLPVPANTPFRYRGAKYEEEGKPVTWSPWRTGNTKESAGSKNSVVTFEHNFPAFSFLKYEIITD